MSSHMWSTATDSHGYKQVWCIDSVALVAIQELLLGGKEGTTGWEKCFSDGTETIE